MKRLPFAGLLAAACFGQAPAPPPTPMPAVSGTPVALATLRYIEIQPGAGTPAAPGKRFTVHYTGWLTDGTKFDSSLDRNDPIQFVQGRRQVISGWDTGFEGMKVGGKRRLLIPYQLAYGEAGSGPIPPKAELIFDVELVNVEDVPPMPPATDVLLPYQDLESRVIALARAIPEDKYTWRPSPAERTFADIFVHIAVANELMLALAEDDLKPADFEAKLAAQEKAAPRGKDAIISRLTESFAAARKDMEAARNGFLTSEAELFGKPNTRRGIFTWLATAVSEQLGQAIAHARANGIMTHWKASELQ